ncbi:hypothetical protein QMN21_28350, partial [Serratia sp. Se-PFBMAAmG]|nr:hypothetical protein [Serratia sp. Se-PFBMAAmG]
DILQGIEDFGERIQPLMQCRQNVITSQKEVA